MTVHTKTNGVQQASPEESQAEKEHSLNAIRVQNVIPKVNAMPQSSIQTAMHEKTKENKTPTPEKWNVAH